jgi:uncharacterized protein YgiM (DUF1202 family)
MRARSRRFLSSYLTGAAAALVLLLFSGFDYLAGAGTGSMYQVAAESALLRDYPSPDSGIVSTLNHRDQVEYVDSNTQGWWKVRSQRTGATGWMTADLLAAARPAAAPVPAKTKYSYVNRPCLELKVIPLESSATTGTVKLNDRLEISSVSPKGWTKVRNPRNGNKGWLPSRFLSSQIVAPPGPAPRKHVRRAGSVKKKKRSEPPKEAVEEQAKPM